MKIGLYIPMFVSHLVNPRPKSAQEEKDKALQRATRVANHSLAVTLSGGGGLEMESVQLDDVKICEN